MKNILTTIFILTSVFVLFFAVQVNAQAVEGCAWSFMKDANYCSDESGGNIPTADESSCAGDPPSDESACCCTTAGWLKINSQYDNNGNKIGTTSNEPAKPREIIMSNLSVSIPGLTKFSKVVCDEKNPTCSIPWIAEYIGAIFEYSMLAVGILGVIVMMIGGIIWLSAGASSSRISQAKDFIKNGLLGTVLALCSYLALFLINPNLTILPPINVSYLELIDVEDTSEPVPMSRITNNPNKEAIEVDSSKWIAVPNDKSGLGITSGSEKSSPASVEALKKGAECFKKLDPQNYIRIADASRTSKEQQSLYKSNCCNGKCKCSPPTCNPYSGGLCPHTSGAAFDAWACKGKGCKGSKLQKQLQQCMISAGFCLLESECWHFEYPQISSACGSRLHYTGKYCT